MESRPYLPYPRTAVGSTLCLFPEASAPPAERQPSTEARTSLTSCPACSPALSLSHIIAEWPLLVKRLGKRRRVLESVLKAGQPLRLIDEALIIGFPPDRRFHQELLDIPEYRSCIEAELARTFSVNLGLGTALHPESRRRRRG